MATEPEEVRRETLRLLRREFVADVELANNLLHELNRYLNQLRTRAPKLLRMEVLPDYPLIKYVAPTELCHLGLKPLQQLSALNEMCLSLRSARQQLCKAMSPGSAALSRLLYLPTLCGQLCHPVDPTLVSTVAGALVLSSSISSKCRNLPSVFAEADELSRTSYLGPRAIPNLFRGGKVTSGLSSLRLVEGSRNGSDDVGAGYGLAGGGGDDTSKGGDTGSGDNIGGSGGDARLYSKELEDLVSDQKGFRWLNLGSISLAVTGMLDVLDPPRDVMSSWVLLRIGLKKRTCTGDEQWVRLQSKLWYSSDGSTWVLWGIKLWDIPLRNKLW
ncbi:hypothetical protein Tco_0796820 [Tanacetum coccineum]